MDRRLFLQSFGALTLTQLLSACGGNPSATLRVKLLKKSLPSQTIEQFARSFQPKAKLEVIPQNNFKDLLKILEDLTKPQARRGSFSLPFTQSQERIVPDLVTLSDSWLANAIEKKLIQPIDPSTLSNWQKLPEQWQNLVKRSDRGFLDPSGKVWGAPYRWASTVIMYRRDKFKKLGWEPKDWEDLWRPELKGRISVLDSYREAIGLSLKYLGRSYNTENIEALANLKPTLEQLHQQVKFYSSNAYLQPLILEDTWLAVGWSTDYLEMKLRNGSDNGISAILPASGTALSADLWVRPASTATNPDVQMMSKWIDFCWDNKSASQISLFTAGSSPIFLNNSFKEPLPEKIQVNPLLLPPKSIASQSEFISPLPPATERQYRQIWEQVRKNSSF